MCHPLRRRRRKSAPRSDRTPATSNSSKAHAKSDHYDYYSQVPSVSISDLKARLSAFIDIVRDGDEVLVTGRGRPVARLVPVRGDAQEDGQRELLIRSGRLRPPSAILAPDF